MFERSSSRGRPEGPQTTPGHEQAGSAASHEPSAELLFHTVALASSSICAQADRRQAPRPSSVPLVLTAGREPAEPCCNQEGRAPHRLGFCSTCSSCRGMAYQLSGIEPWGGRRGGRVSEQHHAALGGEGWVRVSEPHHGCVWAQKCDRRSEGDRVALAVREPWFAVRSAASDLQ